MDKGELRFRIDFYETEGEFVTHVQPKGGGIPAKALLVALTKVMLQILHIGEPEEDKEPKEET